MPFKIYADTKQVDAYTVVNGQALGISRIK